MHVDDFEYSGAVCTDCRMFINNHDDTACADNWDKDATLDTLNVFMIFDTGLDPYFSGEECFGCGSMLAGDRFPIVAETHPLYAAEQAAETMPLAA